MVKFFSIASLLFIGSLKAEPLVIYTEQFPPYNFIKDDRIVGVNIDIIKQACKLAEIECVFKLYPWLRAFTAAQKNANSGVMSTSKNEKRESLFQWVGPLVNSENYFYKLKSRKDINITDAKDLLNYTVSAQSGDIYQEILLDLGFVKDKNILRVSSKFKGVKLFFENKLDLLISADLTLAHQVGKYGYRADELEPVYPLNPKGTFGNFLALNKSVDPSVVNKLQQGVDTLRQSGEFARLTEFYKHNQRQHNP